MITEKIDIRCSESQQDASLFTYILAYSEKLKINNRPMMIVCPGGAYAGVSDRESEIVALQFNAMGYHAAVLKYSVAPYHYPVGILELGKSVAIIRNHAEE